ncbi:glycosyltransferase family A protein [Variovorax sp. tm]|uniref:glycosyltransferase family A protein n=1 Tax=Variovorax atrisoli TaxID=3394203 RepID=UPI003A812439
MLGIVIPAHNEEQLIRGCLCSVRIASQHPALMGEPVETIVALDDCTDATGILASSCGAMTVTIRARNVGMARAVGAKALLARGARWLAFTDADTLVSEDWLAAQLYLQKDGVRAGLVASRPPCSAARGTFPGDLFRLRISSPCAWRKPRRLGGGVSSRRRVQAPRVQRGRRPGECAGRCRLQRILDFAAAGRDQRSHRCTGAWRLCGRAAECRGATPGRIHRRCDATGNCWRVTP